MESWNGHVITPELQESFHRMLMGEAWQFFFRVMVTANYALITDKVDTSREDVRFWQGQKAEAKFLINLLYEIAGLESPLTAHPLGLVSPQLKRSRVEPEGDTPPGETAEAKETPWPKTSEPKLQVAPHPRTTHPV